MTVWRGWGAVRIEKHEYLPRDAPFRRLHTHNCLRAGCRAREVMANGQLEENTPLKLAGKLWRKLQGGPDASRLQDES